MNLEENEKWLKNNGFVANQFGNFVYSKEKHFVNLSYLMKDAQDNLIEHITDFLRVNQKATVKQVLEHLNQMK